MIREIVNGVWKLALGATIIYGCVQTYNYFKESHESYVGANSQTPVVDVMDDTAKIVGNGMQRVGEIVSHSVENNRPRLESLEKIVKDRKSVEDGKEKQQE